MVIDGPFRVTRNTFAYDVGVYRCTLVWNEDARSWTWEIDERVPAAPHAAEGVHVLSKVSGNEDTAEIALEVMQASIRRLERDEGNETQDKYAG